MSYNFQSSSGSNNHTSILKVREIIALILILTLTIFGCKSKSDTPTGKHDSSIKTDPEIKPVFNQLIIEDPIGADSYWAGDSVIIFYSHKNGKGDIKIDGVNYSLDKLAENDGDNSRIITGPEVVVKTSKLVYDEEVGGDCNYGSFAETIVTFKGHDYSLKDLKLQQCPEVFSN